MNIYLLVTKGRYVAVDTESKRYTLVDYLDEASAFYTEEEALQAVKKYALPDTVAVAKIGASGG